jgi:hypothetical protein
VRSSLAPSGHRVVPPGVLLARHMKRVRAGTTLEAGVRKLDVEAILAARILRQDAEKSARDARHPSPVPARAGPRADAAQRAREIRCREDERTSRERLARAVVESFSQSSALGVIQKPGGLRRVSEGELLGFVSKMGWPEPGRAEEWLDRLFAWKLRAVLAAGKRRAAFLTKRGTK